jgi:phospholipid-binding lipoprotein MlaA
MFPIRFLNDLLQCKPVSAVEDLARFAVNTTIGLAGLFDPATHLGLEGYREDFGQTLGFWGIPTGPYLVLPILGPSNPRDTIGLAADSAVAAIVYPYFVPFWVSPAISTTNLLNWRSLKLDEIEAEREAALDYYVAIRNAYVSYRENQVRDSEEDELDSDDLYYLD